MNKDTTTKQTLEVALDARLAELAAQSVQAPAYLAPRIIANLPDIDPLDRIVQWFGQALWRSAAATALPLVLGFIVGTASTAGTDHWEEAEALVYADRITEYDDNEI